MDRMIEKYNLMCLIISFILTWFIIVLASAVAIRKYTKKGNEQHFNLSDIPSYYFLYYISTLVGFGGIVVITPFIGEMPLLKNEVMASSGMSFFIVTVICGILIEGLYNVLVKIGICLDRITMKIQKYIERKIIQKMKPRFLSVLYMIFPQKKKKKKNKKNKKEEQNYSIIKYTSNEDPYKCLQSEDKKRIGILGLIVVGGILWVRKDYVNACVILVLIFNYLTWVINIFNDIQENFSKLFQMSLEKCITVIIIVVTIIAYIAIMVTKSVIQQQAIMLGLILGITFSFITMLIVAGYVNKRRQKSNNA